MNILAINSASLSVKYPLFNMHSETALTSGRLEALVSRRTNGYDVQAQAKELTHNEPRPNQQSAFQCISTVPSESESMTETAELAGIGHRVAMATNCLQDT